jgi:hypothetical protein
MNEEIKKQFDQVQETLSKSFDTKLNDLAQKWNDAENDRETQKTLVKEINAEFASFKKVKPQEASTVSNYLQTH